MSAAPPPTYRERVLDEVQDVPEEYLPALLQVVSAFRDVIALNPVEGSVRRAWAEVQRGDVHPVSELWDGIAGE